MKKLALIALVVVAFFATWYGIKTNAPSTPTVARPEISSQLQDISAKQTNPTTGEIEYTLTAQSMTQNINKQSVVKNITMHWQATPQTHYTITAHTAHFDQTTGQFNFLNGFHLKQKQQNPSPLTLTGDRLNINTQTKHIKSDHPINVTLGNHRFNAQAMMADINKQLYDFSTISASFAPISTTQTSTAPKKTNRNQP